MWLAGLYVVLAYLVAAIPFGVVITTLYGGEQDLRSAGSGNIGGTNVARLYGWRLGALVVALDASKGALPVAAARLLWPELGPWWPALVLFACFFGHCFPIYLEFRGGKGVATAAGGMLVLSPWVLLGSALLWALVLRGTGRSSVASLTAAASLGALAWWLDRAVFGTVLLLAAAIFLTHRANLGRLARGEEQPIVTPGDGT